MLTPELERLIREGKAEYKTYTIGGSGVGTIPVDAQKRIVITDFIWHPFSDQPLVAGEFNISYFPLVQVEYSVEVPFVIIVGDFVSFFDGASLIGTGIIEEVLSPSLITVKVISGDISTATIFLVGASTGTVDAMTSFTLFTPVEGFVDADTLASGTINTDTPVGTPGFSPGTLNVTFTDYFNYINTGDFIVGVDSSAVGVAADSAVPVMETIDLKSTYENAIQKCIHTLRFRSQSKEAVYNFRDVPSTDVIVALLTGQEVPIPIFPAFSFPSPFQTHCYLEFVETVQIDIWKFSFAGNTFTMGTPLPAKANEPDAPAGYNSNLVVRHIQTGQGASIWPLGAVRDPAVTGPASNNQFYDQIGNQTALFQPLSNVSFPLVNIGYVQFNNTEK